MQLILITGLSGSGKSVALNVLEDSGFYCVDNLPPQLVPALMQHLRESGYGRVALSIDARGGTALSELPRQVVDLKQRGIEVTVLFLDAKTDTLIKRYSETRRRHPLSDTGLTLPECIARERELLLVEPQRLLDVAAVGRRVAEVPERHRDDRVQRIRIT